MRGESPAHLGSTLHYSPVHHSVHTCWTVVHALIQCATMHTAAGCPIKGMVHMITMLALIVLIGPGE